MKRIAITTALLLAMLGSAAQAQVTAVITGPKQSDPGDLVVLDASGSTATAFRWVLLGSKKSYLTFDGGKRLVFASGQAGDYTFILVTAGQGQGGALEVATAEHIVTVGVPTPPNPPTPAPGPAPGPTPGPTAAVLPLPGMAVLVLYETDPATSGPKLTRAQAEIVAGAATRQYLTSVCGHSDIGGSYFRFLDVSTPDPKLASGWKAGADRKRDSLPWLIVSNPGKQVGFEGPLPASADEFKALVEKYR